MVTKSRVNIMYEVANRDFGLSSHVIRLIRANYWSTDPNYRCESDQEFYIPMNYKQIKTFPYLDSASNLLTSH